jgi:hypothetical protein
MPTFPVKQQVRSKEQFVPSLCFVISQTTSSIQRTVCTHLHDVVMIQQQVRSKEQFVSTLLSFVYISGQTASLIRRTVCTCLSVLYLQSSVKFDPKNSLYLPICLCFRSSAKFDPKSSLHLSLVLYSLVKWLVRSKERLVPYFSTPWFVYPVSVYLNPQ